MLAIDPVLTMNGLNIIMIIYTLWVFTLNQPSRAMDLGIAGGLGAWLLILHISLSNHLLFPADISGVAFLVIIFAAVGAVGALLLGIPALRRHLMQLTQQQLLLAQGIRVFYGATFLMQASTGVLPQAFGVIDGYTHIGAGFFGLVAAFLIATDDHARRRAWFANLFGLFASTLALVLLPAIGPHHPMMYAVFLPAPLWLWFHLISIYRLTVDARKHCKQL
jgi:hypothetical protein